MEQQKGSNILEGEASESDEEVADYPSFIQNTMVTDFPSPSQPIGNSGGVRSSGVVISGEASESDEEEPFEYARQSSSGREFPSLVRFPEAGAQIELKTDLAATNKDTKYRDEHKKPKFKSPFHKRLRENNFYLRCGIVENTLDTYEDACSKLQSCIPVLSRTQATTQDTLQDLRVMIESLTSMQLRFDCISDSKMLPDFKDLS
eukprot:gene1089-430_t